MTIPTVVVVASGVLWMLLEVWARPANSNESPRYPEFWAWLTEACRIVFAASVLVVLWGKMAERVF